MFVICFSFLNLILYLNQLNSVAGQPNAFLPVLDAIPSPLLQDLPGQYGLAFNGQFGQRFGQRFQPHPQLHHQIEPVRQEPEQVITYQPLLEPHNQIPAAHLQLNEPISGQFENHHPFKNNNQHRNNLKSMLENQQQRPNMNKQRTDEYGNHLIIDNLNAPENQMYENKKTGGKESDALEDLIPQPDKKPNKYEKGIDDLSGIPDPLAQNTPLGAMVSKMEEMLAKEDDEKKKKEDKETKEPDLEPDENPEKENEEKPELNQEMNQGDKEEKPEPNANAENTESEDDYNLNFAGDEKKQTPKDELGDELKTYRTMKNANKKSANAKQQTKSTSSGSIRPGEQFGQKLNSKMNKRLNAQNLHQKLNQNLHQRLREKSNRKANLKLSSKIPNLKPPSNARPSVVITANQPKVNRIVNAKLNPIGSKKQKLLQRNLASETPKTTNRQMLKATRKSRQPTVNQKSNDVQRSSTVDNRLTAVSQDQLRNAKNLTEVSESKTLEQLQMDEDADPELIMKDFDSSDDAKSQDATTLDEFPSYNQLINNFENAELNTHEKFWSLDLEEIDPYKKVDISSYFNNNHNNHNKDKQDTNQPPDDLPIKKDQQVNDDRPSKQSDKQPYQNNRKKMERTTTQTTTTLEPETTTQQEQPEQYEQQEQNEQQDQQDQQEQNEQQEQKEQYEQQEQNEQHEQPEQHEQQEQKEQQQKPAKSEKEETVEGLEMQQFIEDSQPENLNDEVRTEMENANLNEGLNENILERKLSVIKQRSMQSNRRPTITGQSLIFNSKRLKNKF